VPAIVSIVSRTRRALAEKWKLDTEESLVKSARLQGWAETHRYEDYVPEWLLSAWRMPMFEKDASCSPNRD
jgi:hypothetical protein